MEHHAARSAVSSLPARGFSSGATAASASGSTFPGPRPQLLRSIAEVRELVQRSQKEGKSIGLVPTMGALHSGHLALAARSMQENAETIVSIFVNPTQFLPGEDLDAYPRTLDSDLDALGGLGVSYAFAPSVGEMYPSFPAVGARVELAGLEQSVEGRRRPGHFGGVATVVSKLLLIASPSRAYFGQKDGMQCVAVRRLVRELHFDARIIVCPTVRAADGLALSSRNVYLTPQERAAAPVLFRALQRSNDAYLSGERSAQRLKQLAQAKLDSETLGRAEYVSVDSADTGENIPDGKLVEDVRLDAATGQVLQGGAMLSLAFQLGKTRLIDNCILGQELKPGVD